MTSVKTEGVGDDGKPWPVVMGRAPDGQRTAFTLSTRTETEMRLVKYVVTTFLQPLDEAWDADRLEREGWEHLGTTDRGRNVWRAAVWKAEKGVGKVAEEAEEA